MIFNVHNGWLSVDHGSVRRGPIDTGLEYHWRRGVDLGFPPVVDGEALDPSNKL